MSESFHRGLFLLCALAFACSDAEREPLAAGGSAASAGDGAGRDAGGAGGNTSGTGGTGAGSGGTNAAGGSGGVMLGSGGAGGSGGMLADAGEQDASAGMDGGNGETLPAPSLDCTERFDTEHCVSARGELNGVPFDITCTSDDYGFRMRRDLNEVWAMACEDFSIERRVEVWVPITAPGPFSHDTPPLNDLGDQATIQIASPTRNAHTGRDNLEWMLIEGELNLASHNPILTGTFQARFSDTGDICDPASCPAAWVSASFRSVFDF